LPDETFAHIFFECATVRNWHNNFIIDYFPNGYLRDEQDRKNILFLGRVHEPNSDNYFIALTVLIFQHVIWEQKLKKKNAFLSINQIAISRAHKTTLVGKCQSKKREFEN
jgi:hypothetical protein